MGRRSEIECCVVLLAAQLRERKHVFRKKFEGAAPHKRIKNSISPQRLSGSPPDQGHCLPSAGAVTRVHLSSEIPHGNVRALCLPHHTRRPVGMILVPAVAARNTSAAACRTSLFRKKGRGRDSARPRISSRGK
jgi:hypothetical protein